MARKWLAFVALAACHAPPAVAPAPREAPPKRVPVAAPAPEAEPLPASMGALERPAALDRLFAALGRIESLEATDDVRIVQLGDSHTAADWETGPLRRALQQRFGDGGRGFVPVGRPWKAWSQEGLLTGTAGDWLTQMNHPASRRPAGDGLFGLGGVAMSTRQPGARAWVDVLVASSSIELAYLEQPRGGSFDLFVDGTRSAHVATRADAPKAGFRAADLSTTLPHRIEVRATGDGEVRIFGVAIDREERGVVFDALGINGARIAMPLSWPEGAWSESLRHRAPSLVIIAYGTNDAVDVETPLDAVEAGFSEVLARIARAAPSSSCLVLGPPDRATPSVAEWKTPPRLLEVIARERRAAERAGCAFFDTMAALGTTSRWAQPDRVHLSREGYAQVATAFANDLLSAYDTWRRRAKDTSKSP